MCLRCSKFCILFNANFEISRVLLPGGSSWFNRSEGYSDAGEHIYKIAKKINENGDYFPLWGTCLGFELLTYLSADREEHRADCRSERQPLSLDFKSGDDFLRIFRTEIRSSR